MTILGVEGEGIGGIEFSERMKRLVAFTEVRSYQVLVLTPLSLDIYGQNLLITRENTSELGTDLTNLKINKNFI